MVYIVAAQPANLCVVGPFPTHDRMNDWMRHHYDDCHFSIWDQLDGAGEDDLKACFMTPKQVVLDHPPPLSGHYVVLLDNSHLTLAGPFDHARDANIWGVHYMIGHRFTTRWFACYLHDPRQPFTAIKLWPNLVKRLMWDTENA